MNTEEIIRILTRIKDTINFEVTDSQKKMDALNAAIQKLKQEIKPVTLTNAEWIDFLSKQFDISRTSAKEMLHVMMRVKWEDNFKKQFSSGKDKKE